MSAILDVANLPRKPMKVECNASKCTEFHEAPFYNHIYLDAFYSPIQSNTYIYEEQTGIKTTYITFNVKVINSVRNPDFMCINRPLLALSVLVIN